MHSVHFESLCMYIVILVCIVYKTLAIFVFLFFYFFFILGKKKNTVGHVPKLHVAIRPRTLKHVVTWTRVNNPRGHVGTCNKYTCPNSHTY